MLREIHLHGALGERFGGPFRLSVETAIEAGRALSVVLPGFRDAVRNGRFRVVRGSVDDGLELGHTDLHFRLGSAPLHIVPVIAGAGPGGRALGKIVIGIALVGLAVAFAPAGVGLLGANLSAAAVSVGGTTLLTYGNIAALGVGIALSGVSQMLAPAPPTGKDGKDTSFLFNGAANVTAQGGAVPLVYGRTRVGSVVVSAGVIVEQMQSAGSAWSG